MPPPPPEKFPQHCQSSILHIPKGHLRNSGKHQKILCGRHFWVTPKSGFGLWTNNELIMQFPAMFNLRWTHFIYLPNLSSLQQIATELPPIYYSRAELFSVGRCAIHPHDLN